ncbi:MAG: hypothetical protein WB425_09240 [Terracidiphilus sp.]
MLATAPIGGTFIKPEAGQRVYWTKVSTNTKVQIGHIAKKVARTLSHVPPKPGITNTIVQLQSRAVA